MRHIGLSNETPYGVHEFVRLAEQHGLPRVATVQNPYCLVSRTYDNGLDETCYRLNVSMLAYSPLGFGLLTGKYDNDDLKGPLVPDGGRIARYDSMRKQRWGRPEALAAARRYNQLARDHGMTPVSAERVIRMDTLAPQGSYRAVTSGPYAAMEAAPGQEAQLAAALLQPCGHALHAACCERACDTGATACPECRQTWLS